MKLFITLCILGCTTTTYAADDKLPVMLATCEDAVTLIEKTNVWNLLIAKQARNEKTYKQMVVTSPTCIWVNKLAGHNSIYQYDKAGSLHEILIHKDGEERWVINNFNKIKRICWTYHDQQKIEYLRYKGDISRMCALVQTGKGYGNIDTPM